MSLFQNVPANTVGRDFVVGDIHGEFGLVAKGLVRVGFNPRQDRLFCVGDLIDRGPFSLSVLEFLREPWVYAVRGNHEQMFLDLFSDGEPDPLLLSMNVQRNGMGWVLGLSDEQKEKLLLAFGRLPFALEVQTERGSVGLVHAEVPLGQSWQEFREKVEDLDDRTIMSAIWGRVRAHADDSTGVPGIDRVFVGHTIHWNGVKRRANVYSIDTGAVFAREVSSVGEEPRLTLAGLTCESGVLAGPAAPKHFGDLDIRDVHVTSPFGRYVPGSV